MSPSGSASKAGLAQAQPEIPEAASLPSCSHLLDLGLEPQDEWPSCTLTEKERDAEVDLGALGTECPSERPGWDFDFELFACSQPRGRASRSCHPTEPLQVGASSGSPALLALVGGVMVGVE